jgi:hypothetical protein
MSPGRIRFSCEVGVVAADFADRDLRDQPDRLPCARPIVSLAPHVFQH